MLSAVLLIGKVTRLPDHRAGHDIYGTRSLRAEVNQSIEKAFVVLGIRYHPPMLGSLSGGLDLHSGTTLDQDVIRFPCPRSLACHMPMAHQTGQHEVLACLAKQDLLSLSRRHRARVAQPMILAITSTHEARRSALRLGFDDGRWTRGTLLQSTRQLTVQGVVEGFDGKR